jgi:hypothetical protein
MIFSVLSAAAAISLSSSLLVHAQLDSLAHFAGPMTDSKLLFIIGTGLVAGSSIAKALVDLNGRRGRRGSNTSLPSFAAQSQRTEAANRGTTDVA